MSVTPVRNSSLQFSPRDISTPSKETTGIQRTIYSHLSKLHSLLCDWIKICGKGTTLCKAVSALKLQECDNDYYPKTLQPLSENFIITLNCIKDVVADVGNLNKQLKALAKLQETEPMMLTWTSAQISKKVDKVFNDIQKDYALKQIVTENIAHCRNEKLIEVYVSSWELGVYVDVDSINYLFAEAGLPSLVY